MSKAKQLLIELEQKLTEIVDNRKPPATTIAAINDKPIAHEVLLSLFTALVSEAEQHFNADWAAHMTSAVSSSALLGHVLAGLHNGNLISSQLYPLLTRIEEQLLNYFCPLFQQKYGHFMPSGSYANLEALWQAKQHQQHESRIVYASTAAHYSVAKACQILDLDLRTIESIDDSLSISALVKACEQAPPLAIIATAGTSASGQFDCVQDCISIAKKNQAWCHIDASWGGAFRLLPESDALFGDLSLADSISFDPHKALAQPKPCSIILYQHTLSPLLSVDSQYIEQQPTHSLPGSYGGEVFLPLWLSFLTIGAEGFQQQLRELLQQANYFAEQLQQQSNWPVFNSNIGIVCFQTPYGNELDDLVQLGILSKAQRTNNIVYRAVFTTSTRAKAIFDQLQHYF